MNRRQISNTALLLLAAGVLAAGVTACKKDIEFYRTEGEALERNCSEIEFSAYASGVATKALSYDPSYVLGYWDTTSTAYVPGKGIGVFAFHQKVKSNGYPTDFTRDIGEPDFMYNQKLERTGSNDSTFWFTYSPRKYWPNNVNDQLSFFAYAPYDSTTAWEDLCLDMNMKATKISRLYKIEKLIEDQTDFIWVDPILNRKKTDNPEEITFNLRHLCSKVGFSLGVNDGSAAAGIPTAWSDPNTVIQLNTVTIKGVYKQFKYTISWDAATSAWIPSYGEFEGSQNLELKASDGLMQNSEISSTSYTTAAFRQLNTEDGWMMLAPQEGMDVTVSYTLTTTDGDFQSSVTNQYRHNLNLTLEAGKAYMVKILLSPSSLAIISADVVEWDLTENITEVTIP